MPVFGAIALILNVPALLEERNAEPLPLLDTEQPARILLPRQDPGLSKPSAGRPGMGGQQCPAPHVLCWEIPV